MRLLKTSFMAAALALVLASPVSAASITFVDLGTAAPPATLGGITMTAFADDTRALFANETTVDSPLGGVITFSAPMSHREVGSGWATWSHGYTGDVYYSNEATSTTITMPDGTTAFYFYGEPDPFLVISFSATASDGSIFTGSGVIGIDGAGGANGFGFFATDTFITSITFGGDSDFAIGEFGIAQTAVPEPASMLLLGTGLAVLAARRLRRKQ